MKKWIYDIEVFPNLFLICAKNIKTNVKIQYQISPLSDDRKKIILWLKYGVKEMIGFNNLYYDYPVLHNCIIRLWDKKAKDFCKQTFLFSKSIIKGRKIYINEKKHLRKQIDLFKINHYDNRAKNLGLKLLEFNLNLDNIQELPYSPEKTLTNEEIKKVIDYCYNDINATELLYKQTISEIKLREKLTLQYNKDFTNYNSAKIGEYILISKIIDKLGESVVYDFVDTPYGEKKIIKNTKRKIIKLNDIIFPYIKFRSEPFQKILQWFKSKTITETKNVFNKIEFEELKMLEPHYFIDKVTNKQRTLNVIYKGLQYDFGTGGLHASVEAGIYKSDENHELWDVDVKSFYPNLAIKNKYYPNHFGKEFCDIYESIYNERKKYPKKTHPVENLALKLILNSSYGYVLNLNEALYNSNIINEMGELRESLSRNIW